MLYTTPLVAQLIGEEPWLVSRQKRSLSVKFYQINRYYLIFTSKIKPRQMEMNPLNPFPFGKWAEVNLDLNLDWISLNLTRFPRFALTASSFGT
jgi:hypothetical protein